MVARCFQQPCIPCSHSTLVSAPFMLCGSKSSDGHYRECLGRPLRPRPNKVSNITCTHRGLLPDRVCLQPYCELHKTATPADSRGLACFYLTRNSRTRRQGFLASTLVADRGRQNVKALQRELEMNSNAGWVFMSLLICLPPSLHPPHPLAASWHLLLY